MAWETAYRCDRCRRVQRVCTGEFRFYVAPWHGKDVDLFDRIPCWAREGWCQSCRRLRPVELLPDVECLQLMKRIAIEAGLSDLDRELAAQDGRSEQAVLEHRLARIDDQIRWREERASPPKCLTCGSTAVELAAAELIDGRFQHPGCGGLFQISETPCHFQPTRAFLIPADGPEPLRGLRWLWEWIRNRTTF